MKPLKIILLFCAAVVGASIAVASQPKVDPKRIVNESNSFLKEREPDMTEEEYAHAFDQSGVCGQAA